MLSWSLVSLIQIITSALGGNGLLFSFIISTFSRLIIYFFITFRNSVIFLVAVDLEASGASDNKPLSIGLIKFWKNYLLSPNSSMSKKFNNEHKSL